jgi:hypothetical protein
MDVSNVVFGEALHLPTYHVPIFSETKKRAHVLKGETQLACPSDEDQAPLIFFDLQTKMRGRVLTLNGLAEWNCSSIWARCRRCSSV